MTAPRYFLCLYLLKIRLHPCGAFVLHLLRYMTVYVERKARCRVSEVFLHGLHVIALLQSGHGVSVPEIVKACIRASDLSRSGFEAFERRLRVDEVSRLVRKDELPFILPRRAHLRMILKLFAPDVLQYLHDEQRHGKHTRFVILRRR